jgi:hypothetical protein
MVVLDDVAEDAERGNCGGMYACVRECVCELGVKNPQKAVGASLCLSFFFSFSLCLSLARAL